MLQNYETFWAECLGVDVGLWEQPGVSVAAHGTHLQGWNGAWSFRRNARVVLSVPEHWVERLRAAVAAQALTPDQLMAETTLARLFAPEFASLLGPVYQGSLGARAFREAHQPSVRWLSADDHTALQKFRTKCGEEAWSTGGLDETFLYSAAAFVDHEIVAVAGCRAWSAYACDPCILTDPDQRGKGYGAAVASKIVARALSEGKLLVYQTLESNRQAISVARRLGYRQYARNYAIRLKPLAE